MQVTIKRTDLYTSANGTWIFNWEGFIETLTGNEMTLWRNGEKKLCEASATMGCSLWHPMIVAEVRRWKNLILSKIYQRRVMHWEQGHEECLNKDQIFVCFLILQKEGWFYLCITESLKMDYWKSEGQFVPSVLQQAEMVAGCGVPS